MKKARLLLTPMEREYVNRYKELPETTWDKNPTNGSALVQERINKIWEDMKEKQKNKDVSELEKEGCPWLAT